MNDFLWQQQGGWYPNLATDGLQILAVRMIDSLKLLGLLQTQRVERDKEPIG